MKTAANQDDLQKQLDSLSTEELKFLSTFIVTRNLVNHPASNISWEIRLKSNPTKKAYQFFLNRYIIPKSDKLNKNMTFKQILKLNPLLKCKKTVAKYLQKSKKRDAPLEKFKNILWKEAKDVTVVAKALVIEKFITYTWGEISSFFEENDIYQYDNVNIPNLLLELQRISDDFSQVELKSREAFQKIVVKYILILYLTTLFFTVTSSILERNKNRNRNEFSVGLDQIVNYNKFYDAVSKVVKRKFKGREQRKIRGNNIRSIDIIPSKVFSKLRISYTYFFQSRNSQELEILYILDSLNNNIVTRAENLGIIYLEWEFKTFILMGYFDGKAYLKKP